VCPESLNQEKGAASCEHYMDFPPLPEKTPNSTVGGGPQKRRQKKSEEGVLRRKNVKIADIVPALD